jgi:hypothetical protein
VISEAPDSPDRADPPIDHVGHRAELVGEPGDDGNEPDDSGSQATSAASEPAVVALAVGPHEPELVRATAPVGDDVRVGDLVWPPGRVRALAVAGQAAPVVAVHFDVKRFTRFEKRPHRAEWPYATEAPSGQKLQP